MRYQDGCRMGSTTSRAIVCAVACALALSGCSDTNAPSSEPSAFDITGTWTSADLTFTLKSSGDSISGVAVCNITTACGSITDGSPVHGTLVSSTLQLSFEMNPGSGSFEGEVASTTSILGTQTLNGVQSADTLQRVNVQASPATQP